MHQACLQQWIKSSDTRCCELCKYEFIMETRLKPLRKVGGRPGVALPRRAASAGAVPVRRGGAHPRAAATTVSGADFQVPLSHNVFFSFQPRRLAHLCQSFGP